MPDDEPLLSGATKELVRIVELDYDRTSKFIEGVIGTSAAIRGLLVTAWLAVMTLAFNTSRWTLAIVSFAVVVIFGLIDAYHSWLYDQALRHAIDLENVSGGYYGALARGGDDPDAEDDLQAHLQAHRFGVYRNLRRFRMRDLRFARPKIFFQVLYPALLVASIGAAVILGTTGGKTSAQKCYTQAFQTAQPTRSGDNNIPRSATSAQLEKFLACLTANH